MILTICAICSKSFEARPYSPKHGAVRYCSRICRSKARRVPIELRFWPKVNKTETCWLWLGSRAPEGYGHLNTVGKMKLAHRVSWELCNGPIPDGICVLHKCDNPPCVRPDHLFLGTKLDNPTDRLIKGRLGRVTKLNEESVYSMWQLYQNGTSLGELAAQFNVNYSTIWRITHGHRWKHLQLTPCAAVSP
jgi:HNH endonuclease/helix-turn-helix resolvase-like protein